MLKFNRARSFNATAYKTSQKVVNGLYSVFGAFFIMSLYRFGNECVGLGGIENEQKI